MKALRHDDFKAIRKYERVIDYALRLQQRHPESLNADEAVDAMTFTRFVNKHGYIS
jgi:hypothetical protein